MVMNIVCVQVGGNHNLETVSPEFFCHLYSDLMGFLRCHLVSVETLHAVSAYDSTRLVEAQLGNVELLSCVCLPVRLGEATVPGLLRIADI